jgi:hypothetical protein
MSMQAFRMDRPLRASMVALAMLAALWLVLQPFCQAADLPLTASASSLGATLYGPGHGQDDGPHCCAALEARSFAAPASVMPAWIGQGTEAQVLLPHGFAMRAVAPVRALAAAQSSPPLSLPYHVRTSRILR